MSPFQSNFVHSAPMPRRCTHAHYGLLWACTDSHTHTHTWAAADISQRNFRKFREWRVILVKEDQTAGNENHWPSPVTEFTICAWNQLKEERKQRKLAGEGNVSASKNRRPMFEIFLKGMQSFIIQLILLHVYRMELVKKNLLRL